MVEIEEILGLKFFGKQKKKKQIILSHTSRNIEDYISAIKYRNNGNYDKIPNYLISREGKVIKLLPDTSYSNFFKNTNINRNSVIICLENLGWLEKKPLTDYYVNWIGDIYKGDIIEKKWRDYFFWQPYTDLQVSTCSELCKKIVNDFAIDKKCVGHNTKIEGIERFEGIVTKSNFLLESTDLSPAFNFEKFLKYFEDKQFV